MQESIENESRNPYKRFIDRVRFINHSQNYFYEPMTLKELKKIDPQLACQYFNDCFRNPAQFVICLTGSFEVSSRQAFDLSSPHCKSRCIKFLGNILRKAHHKIKIQSQVLWLTRLVKKIMDYNLSSSLWLKIHINQILPRVVGFLLNVSAGPALSRMIQFHLKTGLSLSPKHLDIQMGRFVPAMMAQIPFKPHLLVESNSDPCLIGWVQWKTACSSTLSALSAASWLPFPRPWFCLQFLLPVQLPSLRLVAGGNSATAHWEVFGINSWGRWSSGHETWPNYSIAPPIPARSSRRRCQVQSGLHKSRPCLQ